MLLEKIKNKKKTIAYIYLCIDYDIITDKNQFIFSLLKNIKSSTIGYAGFKFKQNLHNYLINAIFDSQDKNIKKVSKCNLNKYEIIKIIKNVIKLYHKVIPTSTTHIFVFPTFSTFVKQKMGGTTGYTPWKNTILIFINPKSSKWKSALRATIAHEFNHSVFLKYNKWETLLDSLIFEGLAEAFTEHIIDGKQAPWTKALSISQGKKLFLKLRKYLESKDSKLYRSVFFGDKNYPLWTGYSIGYQIVRSFIKNNPGLKWKRIIVLSPKEILKKSNF